MELVGHVKNYDWGKLGQDSLVAQLMVANGLMEEIQDDVPYAELWMGVHPNGQSIVKGSGEPISSILDDNLSFLFKVLSVRKPLSIQVHPNKEQAKQMHSERPDIYKDPNHKPELLIALGPFKALCGFRPFTEINRFMTNIPPLRELLTKETAGVFTEFFNRTLLRELYSNLLTAKDTDVAATITRIQEECKKEMESYELWDDFNRLNDFYPGDVGVLSIFFLNLVNLQAGECIFLEPNDIHAYISGNGVECMACSDNVIRGGLTNKLKDVERLLECLSYRTEDRECKMLRPQNIDPHTVIFSPPVTDFSVMSIHLEATHLAPYHLELPPFPGILLVTDGNRMLCLPDDTCIQVKRGSIVYLAPGNISKVKFLTIDDGSSDDAKEFRAYLATSNILIT